MNHSLSVRFGWAVLFFLWLPFLTAMVTAGSWFWTHAEDGPSSALQALAVRSDAIKLREAATRLSQDIDTFLFDRIAEMQAWTMAPAVVDAVNKVRNAHAKQGFDKLSTRRLESKFRTRKSLGLAPEARTYLNEQVRGSLNFTHVLFTDDNGLNVALTGPTTKFVQREEPWWREARSNGFSISSIKFDASANMWAVDVAMIIRDKGTGRSLGVMKGVLPLRFAQLFSDREMRGLSAPGQFLHSLLHDSAFAISDAASGSPQDDVVGQTHFLVATQDGTLVAETRSSHARDRIMQPEVNMLETPALAYLTAAYGGNRTGSFISTSRDGLSRAGSQSYLVAFSRSAGETFFAPIIGNFPGFGWTVIAEVPNRSVHTVLPERAGTLVGTGWNLGQALLLFSASLCGTLLLSSILLSWLFSRWAVKPLRALTHHVRRVEQGYVNASITVPGTGEIVELAGSLERLRTIIVRMADRLQQTTTAARKPPNESEGGPPPKR